MDDPGLQRENLSPAASSGELVAVVYHELRRLARGHMADESGPQTLTATALVHEAWLRVDGTGERQWENRRHFLGAAAEAMRRILIDRARAKGALKRGGGAAHVPLEELEIAGPTADDQLLAVHEALDKLAMEDSILAEIVQLRYFIGLKWDEISELTGLSERDLQRRWHYARKWLHVEITGAEQ